ncbi:MAG: hypothetical protein US22_C0010G0003 [candidate division TM6 bacterium GW2011_GWF2_36_6]|nr:MAG: hypothetical protein US22_C0010G0003 [candidate division TM6 bacterium GW2011_GWF2_36_6]
MKKFKKIITVFYTGLFLLFINLKSDIIFDNLTSTFHAQNSNSQIYFNYSATTSLSSNFKNGFKIPAGKTILFNTTLPVSGLLDLSGTLSLYSDLYLDTGLIYSGIGRISGNSHAVHLGGKFTIPNSNFIHIGSDTIIEGHGNAINLSDNAEILIDDNVTLTLRNIVINNSKNGVGNPAIKLTSNRSKLALDNAVLNMANDFYVDRGQLFIHNDVSFSGTNALVYRSTVPSYITSKSTLNFDINSIFDFRPSTTGMPSLLAKDLLFMQDATSQLYLNGSTLKTTMTGMRLTKGQIIFDNRVSFTSAAQLQLKGMGSWIYVNNGFSVYSLKFSPDGRYIAAGYDYSTSGYDIYIYDLSLNSIAFANYGAQITSIDWSPDGRYLAVGGFPASGYELKIYSFDGSSLTLIISKDLGSDVNVRTRSVNWSPDGKYLSVGGVYMNSGKEVEIYRFNGSSLTLVASQDSQTGANPIMSTSWSPDSRYIATGEYYSAGGTKLRIYSFNGSSLSLVAETGSFYYIRSIDWSHDGRYLAIACIPSSGELNIYHFNGSSLALITSQAYGDWPYSVNWSPDNRYVVLGGADLYTGHIQVEIYNFNGTSLSITTSQRYGPEAEAFVYSVNFSQDGKYLAVGGSTPLDSGHGEIEVYTLQYGSETDVQSISNSFVFGNSALGSSYDLNVRGLANAQIEIDGLINYDNVT